VPASTFGRAKVREARPLQTAIRDGRRAAVTIRRRRRTYQAPVWLSAALLGLGAFVVVALLIFVLTHKRAASKTRGSTTSSSAPACPFAMPEDPAPMLNRFSNLRAFSGGLHPATPARRQG
jgi:hypothetical protein